MRAIDDHAAFDEMEIRAAERALVSALEDSDPTAWVFHYTADAAFDGGGGEVVKGREALLAMASAMRPMSEVSIRPLRTEGGGGHASVWFEGSWVNGRPPDEGGTVRVRGIIVWRKESDGRWRIALEHLS